jgi:MFS family permease
MLTDLLPKEKLGTGLAVFQAMGWSAAIAGYAAGGFALAALGLQATFSIGAGLCLFSALLVLAIRIRRPAVESMT